MKHMPAGSVKACYGHTEGAAGLHGALCVFLSLQQNIAPPIMHLRSMNPYVSAALADWASSTGRQAAVPRVSVAAFIYAINEFPAVISRLVFPRSIVCCSRPPI